MNRPRNLCQIATLPIYESVALTISRRTSPGAKDSPSFFFHEAIPPSVIVGDLQIHSRVSGELLSLKGPLQSTYIAGKRNLVRAAEEGEAWNSVNKSPPESARSPDGCIKYHLKVYLRRRPVCTCTRAHWRARCWIKLRAEYILKTWNNTRQRARWA